MTVLNGVEILQNDLIEIQLIATNSIAPKDSSQKMLKIVQESFDSLKDASKEGQKIKGILKRLREFSMFTRDQNYRPTSLIEVLNQGLTDYKAMCEQNKIQFTKKIENISLNEGKILGNFNLLTRVISIITDNAITAIIKKKKITSSDFIKVTLEPVINLNQTSLRLSISDSGIGMNQSQLDSLYSPFFSDWAPLEEDELHIGLGMAIVKLIVQNHRGNIEVKSKEQKGTTITIEFPTI